VIWSALVPIGPFFACAFLFEGKEAIVFSLLHITLQTVLALIYLAFVATIVGYAIWGNLLSRYETWRVAPLSLLVPVVGILSAALFLNETLSAQQMLGASVIIVGLLVNVFGGMVTQRFLMRTQP
jgi:O-acetylserine/cysteine efflux transporter